MSSSPDGNKNQGYVRSVPRTSLTFAIDDASQIGEARRAAVALAGELGLSENLQSNLAIVVTESASNILRHAGNGEIVLQAVQAGTNVGVEVLALDKGPGISSMSQSLQDGFSTSGTSGTGLGAIRRLSSVFDVYTRPGAGFALRAVLYAKAATQDTASSEKRDFGIVNRSKPGQDVCGDSWAMHKQGTRTTLLLVDGLGHGPAAAQAARAAVNAFEDTIPSAPGETLSRLHTALQGTRGAAAAIAQWDTDTDLLTFAGIGNIAGMILHDGTTASLVSHYGIVGYQSPKIQEFTYPCPADAVVLLSSDGIATLRTLDAYSGLFDQSAALIAGVLYRDFQRTSDDTTIVVSKAVNQEVLPS